MAAASRLTVFGRLPKTNLRRIGRRLIGVPGPSSSAHGPYEKGRGSLGKGGEPPNNGAIGYQKWLGPFLPKIDILQYVLLLPQLAPVQRGIQSIRFGIGKHIDLKISSRRFASTDTS